MFTYDIHIEPNVNAWHPNTNDRAVVVAAAAGVGGGAAVEAVVEVKSHPLV